VRVLLSTYGSRGDVEPLVALAVRLQERGAEVRVCAPPDEESALRMAELGVPLVPFGRSVRAAMAVTSTPATNLPRRAVEHVARYFDTIAAAAEGCDAVVATGVLPVSVRSVTEKLGIQYVYASYEPVTLSSPPHRSAPPDRPSSPDTTDARVLAEMDDQSMNALFGVATNTYRTAIGLPPVDNVRRHVFTDHPWLAADPILAPGQELTHFDVVQTGAWILPDERPLPAKLRAFLDAGSPPVYVGFGSMPMRTSKDIARVAIEAIRAQGYRALISRGWANLVPVDDRDDCFAVGEVNHQALFGRVAAVVHHGGAGTTTAAATTGTPQVVVAQEALDQPYWANRVATLGIGTAHDSPAPTIESLGAALRTTLALKTRARASAVADMIRTDGATVAATLLVDAISQKGPPSSA
jgi:vancomycin aglycone glucosyltransferase